MYLAALTRRADASCYQHRSIDRYLLFQCRQKLSVQDESIYLVLADELCECVCRRVCRRVRGGGENESVCVCVQSKD